MNMERMFKTLFAMVYLLFSGFSRGMLGCGVPIIILVGIVLMIKSIVFIIFNPLVFLGICGLLIFWGISDDKVQ